MVYGAGRTPKKIPSYAPPPRIVAPRAVDKQQ